MTEGPQNNYERFLFSLFCMGAFILGLITLLILYDVITRNLGLSGITHTLPLTEYGLYYTTLFGAPWLVRKQHHVYMQLITALIADRFRPWVANLSYLMCMITCGLICYYSSLVTIETFVRADHEVRSFDMPRWLIFAVMPLSFFLMTVEFARYLLGLDNMYGTEIEIHE